jgi:hypothetical protein
VVTRPFTKSPVAAGMVPHPQAWVWRRGSTLSGKDDRSLDDPFPAPMLAGEGPTESDSTFLTSLDTWFNLFDRMAFGSVIQPGRRQAVEETEVQALKPGHDHKERYPRNGTTLRGFGEPKTGQSVGEDPARTRRGSGEDLVVLAGRRVSRCTRLTSA